MKVTYKSRTEEELEDYEYRDYLEVFIDGKLVFKVQDDEPEDSNLSRSFSDCYSVPKLLEMAYKAGKNGEDFQIEDIT